MTKQGNGCASERGAAALGVSVETYDRLIADAVDAALPRLIEALKGKV